MLRLRALGKNVTVDTRKMDIPLHSAVQWRRHGDHRLVGLHKYSAFGIKIHNNGLPAKVKFKVTVWT